MRLSEIALLLAAASGSVSAQDFAGQWNITVLGQGEPHAWWLEVSGGDTGKGRFVGAPGGQTDDLQDVSIRDGELRFSLTRRWRGPQQPAAAAVFTAHLTKGTLRGALSLDGEPKVQWIGKRAPVIPDRDDGTWRPGKPVELFNGKDLSGWVPQGKPIVYVPPTPVITDIGKSGWTVKDGYLATEGKGIYIATRKKFWSFTMHAEFRVGPGGNSGIGLRGRYELQVFDDHDRPVDKHSAGGIYGRIIPTVNASKPAGEWQAYDVRLVGREVTVVLNGIKVIDKGIIEGPTAVVTDPNEDQPGPISLQGDHGAVDFRKIVITPLLK